MARSVWQLANGMLIQGKHGQTITVRCESCGGRVEPGSATIRLHDLDGERENGGQLVLVLCEQCSRHLGKAEEVAIKEALNG